MKDERRDDDRENGTNGEERKGMEPELDATWEDDLVIR